MEVYEKVVGEDGTVEYRVVEVKRVIDESEDGQKIKAALKTANDEAKKLRLKVKEDSDDSTPPPAAPVAAPFDPEALFNQFAERLTQREREAQAQANQRRNTIKGIAEKHKLPDNLIPLLEKSEDPEFTASELTRINARFDDVKGGQPDKETAMQSILNNIDKRLELNSNSPGLV